MIASPVGAVSAAQKPFTTRVAMRSEGSSARAPISEAAAKPRRAAR